MRSWLLLSIIEVLHYKTFNNVTERKQKSHDNRHKSSFGEAIINGSKEVTNERTIKRVVRSN